MDPQTIFSRHFFYFNLMGIDLYPSGVKWKKYLIKFAFYNYLASCIQYFLFGGYYLMFTVDSIEKFTDAVASFFSVIDTTVKLIAYGFLGTNCCSLINFLMEILNEGKSGLIF
jgi:hypothetical protein